MREKDSQAREEDERVVSSKERFKPQVGLSVRPHRQEYLTMVHGLDAELELGGRLDAYVAKRIKWEENRHLKAGKEPFHLQFIGKYGAKLYHYNI